MSHLNNLPPAEVKQRREDEVSSNFTIPIDDGVLFLRSWSPLSPTDTAVLILHGITAHSKPYSVLAENITSVGFQAFGLDLRGHGLSDGTRGDYHSNEELKQDLQSTLAFIKNQGYEHIIILGHSLGVVTALKIVQHHLGDLAGVALFSAALKTRESVYPTPSLLQKLKILVNSLLRPSHPIITYHRQGMQGVDDPLFNFKYTYRFMKIFSQETIQIPITIDVPLFFGIGDKDELFDVKDAKDLFDQIQADDKMFDIMKDSTHAEFTETAFDEFTTWLSMKFGK